MQSLHIVEEKFETAEEFLETLRITNRRWISKQNNWDTPWIFRGQPDANMQLIPTAWRDSKLERFKRKYRPKFEEIHLGRKKIHLEQIEKQIEKGEISVDEGKERTISLSEQTDASGKRIHRVCR
jgi:hypothetical protein